MGELNEVIQNRQQELQELSNELADVANQQLIKDEERQELIEERKRQEDLIRKLEMDRERLMNNYQAATSGRQQGQGPAAGANGGGLAQMASTAMSNVRHPGASERSNADRGKKR